jgi:hypothetical protein
MKKINLFDSDNLIELFGDELLEYMSQYRNRINPEMFDEDVVETSKLMVRGIFLNIQMDIDNIQSTD